MPDAGLVETPAHGRDNLLMAAAFDGAGLQMPHAGKRPGGDGGRQGRRKDKARGEAAHKIAQRGRRGDIAADDAEGLRQCPFDHRQPMTDAEAPGNPAAARAVEPDRMDLVEIGHGAKGLGRVAQFGNRRDVAIHRVDRLKGDELGPGGVDPGEQAAEILGVVMGEDVLLGTAAADSFDHRGVIRRVGEDDAIGQPRRERAEGRPVRHIARGEQQRRLLAVQLGELAFEADVIVVGAGDVAGAAGAGAATVERFVHRRDHSRVLAHAEIVVRAPHRHLAALAVTAKIGEREGAGAPFEVGKHPVVASAAQTVELPAEKPFVVHRHLRSRGCLAHSSAGSAAKRYRRSCSGFG